MGSAYKTFWVWDQFVLKLQIGQILTSMSKSYLSWVWACFQATHMPKGVRFAETMPEKSLRSKPISDSRYFISTGLWVTWRFIGTQTVCLCYYTQGKAINRLGVKNVSIANCRSPDQGLHHLHCTYSHAHYKIEFISGSGAVPVHWNVIVFSPRFAIFKNVVYSLEPGETPSNSASHQVPNYAQRS